MRWTNLTGLAVRTASVARAVAAYREVVKLAPRQAAGHVNLGGLLFLHGDLDAAMAACTEVVRLDPGRAEAHIDLGFALANGGDRDEAVEVFERGFGWAPGSGWRTTGSGSRWRARATSTGRSRHGGRPSDSTHTTGGIRSVWRT